MELVFRVTQETDGGYVADCFTHFIVTQGDTWNEFTANVREAVAAFFFDQPQPQLLRLQCVRREVHSVDS